MVGSDMSLINECMLTLEEGGTTFQAPLMAVNHTPISLSAGVSTQAMASMCLARQVQ